MRRLRKDAGEVPLIAIEASPGYGKSTVMRQWMEVRAGQGWRTAWLSLDAADDEPSRFASMLVGVFAALVGKQNIIGSSELVELDAVISEILGHCFAYDRAVLFIDDFHVISNEAIHDAIGRIAMEAPEGLQVVISSRAALPLAMAKARLMGSAVLLQEADLAFDQAEARSMLSGICNREISEEDAERLRSRAGGWVAMLQLAALALDASADPGRFIDEFSGMDVEVSQYLCEVTLDLQSPPVRKLLLASSPLDLFSPELCTALTGQANSRALLAEIEARHLLLIPLDRQRRWFKYHALFREFLEARLEMELPGERERILLTAARWLLQAREPVLAIEHALRGGHFTEAATILSEHVADISLRRGEHATIQRWIALLPPDTLGAYPALKLGLAWALTFRHENEEVERLLASVEAAVPRCLDSGVMTPAQADETLASCHMVRAVAHGAADRHAQAWQTYRSFEQRWPGATMVQRVTIMTASAYSALAMGRVREARRITGEVLGLGVSRDVPYAYGWLCIVRARLAMFDGRVNDVIDEVRRVVDDEYLDLKPGGLVRDLLTICAAEALYEAGWLDEARKAINAAAESVLSHATVEVGEPATRILARLALAFGDEEQALNILHRSMSIAERLRLYRLAELIGCELATTLLRLGRNEGAWQVEQQMDLSRQTPVEFAASLEARQMVRARLMLSRGDGLRAARAAASLWNRLRSTGNVRQQISALCIHAAAQWQMGNADQAQRLVAQARMTAEQSGLRRAIIDEDYLLRSISAVPAQAEGRALVNGMRADPNGTLLSHREGHVLSLMSQGMTNRDIAGALVISEETVKWHMRNITKKLHARNRTHAVQIARQTGLLQ
ncbi:MAG: LuxR C-terminal-related transcriptional regulator [Zavarzinia sp.]|nr:LuxR C-terminal-related transcriptional regulator [Zavarzinia sp.]